MRFVDQSSSSSVPNQYPYNPGNDAFNELEQSQTRAKRPTEPKQFPQPVSEQPPASTDRRRRDASKQETGADASVHTFVGHLLTDSLTNSSTYRSLAVRAAAAHADLSLESAFRPLQEPQHALHEGHDALPSEAQNIAHGRRVASDSEIDEALARGRGALEQVKLSAPTRHVPHVPDSLLHRPENRAEPALAGQRWSPRTNATSKKRYRRELGYLARYTDVDHEALRRVLDLIAQKDKVTAQNCKSLSPEELVLPGAVAYDIERQFDNQVWRQAGHSNCRRMQLEN